MVALLASVAAALVAAAPAMASACGDKVLADWYDDGRIDRIYDAHCYEDAIDAIPKDIGPYVDAEEVITRALQASLRGKLAPGGPDPTPGDDRTPGGPVSGGDDPSDPGGEAAGEVDTSAPSSVPIPLLVLGGMSIALLVAGGLGYVSRRRNATGDGDGPDAPDDLAL
jgi:hypothetical protein